MTDFANGETELYRSEIEEHVEGLDSALLALERSHDPETIAAAFRHLHSLKGAAAAMGHSRVHALAHRLEDALAAVRDSGRDVPSDLLALAFACNDHFRSHVDGLDGLGETDDSDVAGLLDRIGAFVVRASEPETLDEALGGQRVSNLLRTEAVDLLRIRMDHTLPLVDLKARAILRRINELVATGAPDPAPEDLATADFVMDVPLLEAATRVDLGAALDMVGVIDWELGATPSRPVSPPPAPPEPDTSTPHSMSLRVGVAALDVLADLAGELVTVRARLNDTVGSVAQALDPSQSALRSELLRVSDDVSGVVGRLQEATIDLRLVPLESVFRRFRRVVRDAALGSGKEVDLSIRGEQTGVDKRLIDGLADPLTHLVRNAIDHGLESPEERRRLGKPPRGQLLLSASQQGNSVVVTLSDDGRGIDLDAVRGKLVSDGRLDAERASQLDRDELVSFLFLPGVTTRDEVSELSGRGVGLDAVRSMISRLHGTVELTTEPGHGTEISLRLPSTMAIVHSLIVRVGDHYLGIPIEDVREVVSIDDVTITPVGDESTMLLRGEFLPVVDIRARLSLDVLEPEGGQRLAAVLTTGSKQIACLIDSAVGTEDLVIKSIGGGLGTRRGLSGASFLGDGNVALIVDTSAMIGGMP